MNKSRKKKWHVWIALAAALFMLAVMAVPANVPQVHGESSLRDPRTDEEGTVTWDCVWFGHYPQSSYEPKEVPANPEENKIYTEDGVDFVYVADPWNGTNKGKSHYYKVESIKWRVLAVREGEAFLLAERNLDSGIPYYESREDVIWERSTLRSWLNGSASSSFFNQAFTSGEQNAILETLIENPDNPDWGTEGGPDTEDKVFPLSIEEVTNPAYGFAADPDEKSMTRSANNTEYTVTKNEWMKQNSNYWLRSPGYDSSNAAYVNTSDNVDSFCSVNFTDIAVRPALHLDLGSDLWQSAGTVTVYSDGMVTEDETPGGGEEPDEPETNPDYKPVEEVDMGSFGESGTLKLFEDAGGEADGDVTVFPGNYDLKFPAASASVSKESMEDGTYKYKMAIGVDKNTAFGSEQGWENLKKDLQDAKENVGRVKTLKTLMEKWDAESGYFTLTKSFKAKPEINTIGYYEAIYDENGGVISDSGGLLLECKWNASVTNQWLIGPVPIYVELEGKLKGVGQADVEQTLSESGLFLSGKVNLTPGIAAGAGAGISGAATVGVKGSADVDIQLIPASKGSFEAGIAATAKLVFVFDWEYPLAKATFPLWDTTKNLLAGTYSFGKASLNSIKLSLADRSYQAHTTEWNGQPAGRSLLKGKAGTGAATADQSGTNGTISWKLQEAVLPDTVPLMKQIGGDTVMIFQENDPQRETQNSSKLVYSVYNGMQWTEPKALWDNGTLDGLADLEVINGELYVVWQKCRDVLPAPETNTEAALLPVIRQAAESSEICWAKYNQQTKAFEQAAYLTDNELPDLMPVLEEGTDIPTVLWVENDMADLTGESGTKTIRLSSQSGGSWSEPQAIGTTADYISELRGCRQDGLDMVAYICLEEEKRPVLYLAKSGKVETQIGKSGEEDGELCGLGFKDGLVTYKQDGVMKQYRIADGTLSEKATGNTQAIGANAEHYVRGDQDAILWMSNSEDGCILYTSVKTEENCSEPVIVYQNTELRGNYFTAQLMEDGSWEIILNASDMGKEESSLYFIKKENRPQVELEDIVLNEAEENEEGYPFSYSLTNSSQEPVSEFQLTVKEGNAVLLDKTVETEIPILPGETLYFEDTLSLDSPEQSGASELTIQASAAGQEEPSLREQTVRRADVAVSVEKTVLDKSVRFTAAVTNNGQTAADGEVVLYGDAESNRVIQNETFRTLTPGEQTTVELEYPVVDMTFNEKESAYCKVQVKTDQEEYSQTNNSYYGATYLWELPEDNFHIAGFALSGAGGSYVYSGKAICPAVSLKGLTAGKDYIVLYENNINAGTAKVIVTGIGRYHGEIEKTFIIRKASQIITANSYTKTYGNKAFSLGARAKTKLSYRSSDTKTASVNSGGQVTLNGPGKAVITITAAAAGNYNAASKNITITVKPKNAVLKKAKSKKARSLQVSWKRDKKATGYQIMIAQNKKFTKGKKTALIRKNKTTSKTFKKLKRRKNYYYKVRAYKQVGKTKIYGAYSKTKRIKVK